MAEPLRVATFNIRREGVESDPRDLWEARRQPVADLIRSLGASVVGLQEVKPSQLMFLVEALSPEYVCVGGEGREADRGGEASPLFVRAEGLEVKRSQILWISATPHEPGSRCAGAHCPRVLSCAELRRPDGSSVCCFNTHLDHAGLKDAEPGFLVQRDQAALLCGLVDGFCGAPAQPRVVLGDLNSGLDAGAPPVLRREGYVDASGGDGARTFCGFDGSGSELTNVYGSTQKVTTHIDWIFAKGLAVESYAVLEGRYEAADGTLRYHSDHLPVVAGLSFETAGQEQPAKRRRS